MYRSKEKRTKPPLDSDGLRDLALQYVGRYATTKSKLSRYLFQKIADRGWQSERPADIAALVADFSERGYVDDAAFAESRARSFVRRGYGGNRLRQELHAAGIDDGDACAAQVQMGDSAFMAAENFARRKRIGPFASAIAAPDKQQKQLAAFLRAGHNLDLAKRFVLAEPGAMPEPE